MSSERAFRLASVIISAIALAACELGETQVSPVQQPRLVVHAVLSPTSSTQMLLLERSWDGDKYIWKTGRSYSQTDPIGGGGGYGEVSAEVDLILPDGTVRRATEARLIFMSPYGPGVYLLPVTGPSIVPGGRYQVRIRTAAGEELHSETTIPSFPPTVPIEQMDFDRERDTMTIAWPRRPGARAYHVVLESPYGQTSFFTDTTAVRLTGSLRSVSIEGLPHVFIPGFTQSVTIAAVDTNYYDYFRSSNHSQTGTGIVNRVQGGLGVFGSVAPAVRRRLRVTAPFTQPFEGRYRYLGSPEDSVRTLMIGLTVHLEASAAKADAPDAISGAYQARTGVVNTSQLTGGMLGLRWRDSLRLVFLNNQVSTDTLEVFRARIAGDTIIGSYRFRVGEWRFLKQR